MRFGILFSHLLLHLLLLLLDDDLAGGSGSTHFETLLLLLLCRHRSSHLLLKKATLGERCLLSAANGASTAQTPTGIIARIVSATRRWRILLLLLLYLPSLLLL